MSAISYINWLLANPTATDSEMNEKLKSVPASEVERMRRCVGDCNR